MKKIISILAGIITFSVGTAFASGDFMTDFTYDAQTGTITVVGSTGTEGMQCIDTLLFKGRDANVPDEDNTVDYRMNYTDDNGDFSFKIPLSDTLSGGVYTLCISSETDKSTQNIVIVNNEESAEALAKLNNAKDEKTVANELMQNYEKFGLQDNTDKTKIELAAKMVFESKPENGYKSAAEVQYIIEKAAIIYEMKNANTLEAFDKVLKNKGNVLNIEYSEFEKIEESAKKELFSYIKSYSYGKNGFEKDYDEMLMLAQICGASTWYKQKEMLIQYGKNFDINLDNNTNYNKVQNKDKVFQNLFDRKPHSETALKSSFETAVSEVLNGENRQTTGTGGGSGGSSGGSSGGNYTATPGVQTPSSEKNELPFSDISTHWAKNEITELSAKKIINGFDDGTFRPDFNCTRAEFVTIIVNAFNLTGGGEILYNDIQTGAWYTSAIAAAAQTGVINGYPDGGFHPEDKITREEAAVVIYRLLNFLGLNTDGNMEFSDSSQISDFAKEAVGKLGGAGIVSGTDTGFEPKEYITRAQTVKIIWNILKTYNLK